MRGSGKVWLTAGLAAILVWPGVVIAASSITGTITFDGKVPNLKPLAMDADPACAKKHGKPVMSESAGARQRQHHGKCPGVCLEGSAGG